MKTHLRQGHPTRSPAVWEQQITMCGKPLGSLPITAGTPTCRLCLRWLRTIGEPQHRRAAFHVKRGESVDLAKSTDSRKGGPVMAAGECRWCECTDVEPCLGGCAWMDSACTLCSACAPVDVAWKDEPSRRRNMRLAFFRGFLVGAGDRRALEGRNPYAHGAAQRQAWERGRAAGAGVPR